MEIHFKRAALADVKIHRSSLAAYEVFQIGGLVAAFGPAALAVPDKAEQGRALRYLVINDFAHLHATQDTVPLLVVTSALNPEEIEDLGWQSLRHALQAGDIKPARLHEVVEAISASCPKRLWPDFGIDPLRDSSKLRRHLGLRRKLNEPVKTPFEQVREDLQKLREQGV